MSAIPILVLHVDDDQDDRTLFSRAMHKAGIDANIVHAADGAECLRKLETITPEIIFLDINMAGMNGKECLKNIRAEQRFDSIPVIMLSTSDHVSDIEETFESGASLFTVKPFRTDDLVVLLKNIFTGNWRQHLLQRNRASYVRTVV
ncbi:response regulator [Ferruginibacter sp.]